MGEFARTMLTDFPVQAILDRLVERIVDVLPVTAAGVTLISEGREPRYVSASDAAALTLEKLQSSLGQGPCVSAYESGEAVTVPNLAVDGRFPDFVTAAAATGVAAVFAFPMRHNDGRLGALDLYRDTTGALEPWSMSAAQTLADVAAAYLLNAQARELSAEGAAALRMTALHDPLTGLPNRTMLQMRLDHVAERASRSHLRAAVLFADLDEFKQVNDAHGHPVGDALLIAVSRRLSGLLRPGDTLARVSGVEFVILCEDLSNASDSMPWPAGSGRGSLRRSACRQSTAGPAPRWRSRSPPAWESRSPETPTTWAPSSSTTRTWRCTRSSARAATATRSST